MLRAIIDGYPWRCVRNQQPGAEILPEGPQPLDTLPFLDASDFQRTEKISRILLLPTCSTSSLKPRRSYRSSRSANFNRERTSTRLIVRVTS